MANRIETCPVCGAVVRNECFCEECGFNFDLDMDDELD